MKVVVLGLSITSSWGNGHATTYRGLMRELAARGHAVLFLERERPWYADNRDLRRLPGVEIALYRSLAELKRRHAEDVRRADAVIVGSFVPSGAAVGDWVLRTVDGVTAFYDIDTPVTLAGLQEGSVAYLAREQIARYDLYLSFTGGPTLRRLEDEFGSPRARALYCSFDPLLYFPEEAEPEWNLGYLGTYSDDRQPPLERLLIECARRWPAGRFVVAGAQYPRRLVWPRNVRRIEHLAPGKHRAFYNRQQFTLNVTRTNMIAAGWSPSVRLFEAAACGTPIISDWWRGLDELFAPGEEVLIARSTDDAMRLLTETTLERARAIGAAARRKVLARHTAAHRAVELEAYLHEARGEHPASAPVRGSNDARQDLRVPSSEGGQAGPFARREWHENNRTRGDENLTMNTAVLMDFSPTRSGGLAAEAAKLGPWFHNLHLPDGTQTAPAHPLGDFPNFKWREIAPHLPEDLRGWTALDVGCNAGFYALELARRGAHVVALDREELFLNQARWAARHFPFGKNIEVRQGQVYDVAHWEERFDLVLFLGVFYHLRYPLLALDILAERVQRRLVFQTLTIPGLEVAATPEDQDFNDRAPMTQAGWPKMAFIEKKLAGDATNWWAANHAGVEALLRSSGFRVVARPGHEIYLCEPNDAAHARCVRTWDEEEILAATGRCRLAGASEQGEGDA